MTRLAIEGEPGFAISLADAPKPSAIATSRPITPSIRCRACAPPRRPDAALYCLMGADSFFGLSRWHRAAEIPFVAPLIVASRPGQPLEELEAALPPGLTLESERGWRQERVGVEVRAFFLVNSGWATERLFMCCLGWMWRSARRRFGTGIRAQHARRATRRAECIRARDRPLAARRGAELHRECHGLCTGEGYSPAAAIWRLFAPPRSDRLRWAWRTFPRMKIIAAQKQTRILVQAAAAVCEEKKGQHTRILELDPDRLRAL